MTCHHQEAALVAVGEAAVSMIVSIAVTLMVHPTPLRLSTMTPLIVLVTRVATIMIVIGTDM